MCLRRVQALSSDSVPFALLDRSTDPYVPHHVQDTWLVKDTSTNGSFVNNVRVGKGNEAPLKVDDVLRLSQAVGEKNKLIECTTIEAHIISRRPHTCWPSHHGVQCTAAGDITLSNCHFRNSTCHVSKTMVIV